MEKECKLFDKRFVHFIWDDELEGKKGFIGDYVCAIEHDVNNSPFLFAVHKGTEENPFMSDGIKCRFFYYDPNYEVKWAYYKEGKKIQVKSLVGGRWCDCGNMDGIWTDKYEYRVKPDCPCEEKTFRPFKDCDELIEFWSKNYQTALRPAQTKPLIWVRLKCDGRERLIVAFGKGFGTDFVEIGNKAKAVTLQHLFEQYEFLDGSPCGAEAEIAKEETK